MEFDLVDEMHWEELVEFLTLEEAGLEESAADSAMDCVGVMRMMEWFYEEEFEYCEV